jgi:hypothetical protein
MDNPQIPTTEAARALAEVHARRDQVVRGTLVPDWFWPAVGALMVAFIAAVESGRTSAVAVGTVVYVIGLATVIGRVATRQRAQVRNALLGARGGLAIATLVVLLVGLGLGVGLGLDALGAPYPATIAGAVTAVAMTLTGPLLMRHLHTVMTSRPVAGGR